MTHPAPWLSPLALFIAVSITATAGAQSGSSSSSRPAYQGSGSNQAGSGTVTTGRGVRTVETALDGFCAVCLTEKHEWVAGSSDFLMAFDGQQYRFPGTEQMAMFRANPAKYAPVLGGDDVIEYSRTGKRVAGKLGFGARHADRHYFFVSQANKDAFMASPAQFSNADVAVGGACVVCQVDMRRQMGGNPQIAALHDGMRYYFVGTQQRDAFVANPAAYVSSVPAPASGTGSGFRSVPAGSGSAGSGSGTR